MIRLLLLWAEDLRYAEILVMIVGEMRLKRGGLTFVEDEKVVCSLNNSVYLGK